MRKNLFKAFILCTLIPSMWLSAANAVSPDAKCLSFTTEAGATFTLCLEGDVNKGKLTNKAKSEILELAHQLKSDAMAEPLAKKRNFGYDGMDSGAVPDYDSGEEYPIPEEPATHVDPIDDPDLAGGPDTPGPYTPGGPVGVPI